MTPNRPGHPGRKQEPLWRPSDETRIAPARLRRFAERAVKSAPRERGRCTIEQRGHLRLKPNGQWKPFMARQWFSTTDPAFCWTARVRMAPLVSTTVVDAYVDGRGALDAKLWGVVPVAKERGAELDRGELQRYLAELPWNPFAILHNSALRFAKGEEGSTRVWCKDPRTHVDLHFDDGGDIVRVRSTTRSRGRHGPAPWEGVFADYTDFGPVRIPAYAEVCWLLPEGRFTYFRGHVTSFAWGDASSAAV